MCLLIPIVTLASEVRHEHPRLYLTSSINQNIQEQILTPDGQKKWLKIKAFADEIVDDSKVDDGYRALKIARLLLLANKVSKNPLYVYQAQAIFEHMRKPLAEEKDDQEVCPKIETAALLYDWAYNDLTDLEKSAYMQYILAAINWLEQSGYLSVKGVVGGHQITGHKCALTGLIAIKYDTDLGDSYFSQITDNFFNYYLPFYRFLSEEDGSFHMGMEYSRYYLFSIVNSMDLWRSATGDDLFLQNNWLIKSQRFLLANLNDQNEFFKIGDIHAPQLKYEDRLFALKIAQEYHDGIAQSAAEWMFQNNVGVDAVDLVYDLLWTKQKILSQSFNVLPKVNLFAKAGIVSFRESWDINAKAGFVSAIFKSTPTYFTNHSHRDVNSFSISLNSDLALDSGYYDYYKSEHWRNYYTQSIAHNTLVFQNESTNEFIGQENKNAPESLSELKAGQFNVGGIDAFENTDLYSYAKGLGQNAYPQRLLNKFERHFVFLNDVKNQDKPVIIIFDDVRLQNKNFKPTWLLHCLTEPQIINERELSCFNDKSRLDVSIIQPQMPKLALVGGKNAEFINNGTNYPTSKYGSFDGIAPAYAGSWRIELQNKEKSTEQFLVVLAAKDKKEQKKLDAKPIANQQQAWQGVELENWRLFFSEDDANQMMNFNINPKQHVLIVGLAKKQTYLVSGLNNKNVELLSTEAGTLLLQTNVESIVHLQKKPTLN